MAESPGKLLSSICLGGESSSSSQSGNKYGGSCVNIFIHLFDWNRRLSRGSLFNSSRRLLGSQEQLNSRKRRKNRRKNMNLVEDRLPMAKLLLIADENRREGDGIEIRSLQELLHQEQEEPKMLQELLASKNSSRRVEEEQNKGPEVLLNLLIQEVKCRQERQERQSKQVKPEVGLLSKQLVGAPERPSRSNSRMRSLSSKCPHSASVATVGVAESGCGAFSRRSSGLFLEAAAKILDPRNKPSRRPTRALGRVSSDSSRVPGASEENAGDMKAVSEVVAPETPSPNFEKITSRSSSSVEDTASIRSLMELFLDDLEQDMAASTTAIAARSSCSSSERLVSASEACSPERERRTVSLAPPTPPPQEKVVPVDDLEEHDYVSFRDFLTAGGARARKAETRSKEPEEPASRESVPAEEFKFMVHNPLFDDSSTSRTYYSDSELDNEDDQGLEEILKSILYQSTTTAEQPADTARLTWLPDSTSNLSSRENFLYNNKDTCSEADSNHQTDIDSVELTSESNCGDDCSQPSPVSVLDSPFDDEVSRKGKRASSARKRLDFGDDPVTSTSSATSSSSRSFISRLQRLDLNTLDEAEDYVMMVLEESGISYHSDVTLLLPENGGGIVNNSVFERLEDRVRVQQLIEHLEACGSTSKSEERSSHHSLESLRAHYESYHECRSRRRMVFDFVNEVLASIVDRIGENEGSRRIRSGKDLVSEAQRQLLEWRRQAFENVQELVNRDISSSSSKQWKSFHEQVFDIGTGFVREILTSMVEELARDLLAR